MGKLILKCGNILDYLDGVDAIVNSTNKYMICGSGVCGAIYRGANKDKLEDYCRSNFKGLMIINEVRITKGFDLNMDIMHIYCPKYYDSKNPIDELKQSYINIFKVAKENKYSKIISVSLGTGIHGYKHNYIAKDIIQLIIQLVDKLNIGFILVLSDEETIQLYNGFL